MLSRLDDVNFAFAPSNLVPFVDSNNATSPFNSFRDPRVLRYNGACYAASSSTAWAGLSPTPSFNIYVSDGDCIANPNPQFRFCTAAYTGVGNSWGPDWFVDSDGSVHITVAIPVSSTRQIFEMHPQVPGKLCGSNVWSVPVQMTGSGLPTSMLAQAVLKIGATYYMWYSNQSSAAYIEVATSTNLITGWTVAKSGNWQGYPSAIGSVNFAGNLEAPCPIYKGPTSAGFYKAGTNGTWEVLIDARGQGMFSSTSTSGILGTYSTPVPLVTPGGVVQELCAVKDASDYVFDQDTTLTSNVPALSSAGSGSPALDNNARDDAATITEGTGATGFTFTFSKPKSLPPHCSVSPTNGGAPLASLTTSTTAVQVAHASQSNFSYALTCVP
jgi:hypothetical protein